MSKYTLYVKQDCGLCDEFLYELGSKIPEQINNFQVVDITGKSELLEQYGEKIPVVIEDNAIVCQYFFDIDVFK